MTPLLIAGLVGITGLAYLRAGKKSMSPIEMSPKLREEFQKLLDSKRSGEVYEAAADKFEAAGFHAEALLLRKRAGLASLPKEDKQKLKRAYSAAMASPKPDGIRAVAEVLASKGAVGAAQNLREHAEWVAIANSITPVAPESEESIDDSSEQAVPKEKPTSEVTPS